MQSTSQSLTSEPLRPRKPRVAHSTLMLCTAGTVFLVFGIIMALGADHLSAYVPNVVWYAKLAHRAGFEAGILCTLGMVLVGLGFVSKSQRLHAETLLQKGESELHVEQTLAFVKKVGQRLEELQDKQTALDERVATVLTTLLEQHEERMNDGHGDALFRLAASMDQLGARVEQRIGESAMTLHDGVREVKAIVEESSAWVHDGISESTRRLAELEERAGLFMDPNCELPASAPNFEDHHYEVFDTAPEDEPGPEDIEILVEFEEGTGEHTDLGLLDEIEDFGGLQDSTETMRAPLPTPPPFDPQTMESEQPFVQDDSTSPS